MKKNLMALLVAITPFMFSCKKDMPADMSEKQPATTSVANRENCEPFQFGVLGLNGGTVIMNGLDYLTGDVGLSQNTISTNNANILNFEGASLVHSKALNFLCTSNSYQPLYGIWTDPMCDEKMNQANTYALNLCPKYAALPAQTNILSITSNKTITSVPGNVNTIVKVGSVNLSNGEKITLVGNIGTDDGFIINVTGNFTISQGSINLVNVRPERVLFNFPNASQVVVDRSAFNGTILARTGTVICFEPPSFDGSIIAKNVTVFSYGSILGSSSGSGSQWRGQTTSTTGGTTTSNCLWVTNFTQRTYCNGNQW